MKKIILILALMTWYNVQAETLYTDYEFQGYTEERLEDDELTKYEEVKINRFYELVEREITYNNMTEPGVYDCVDLNDFIISGGYTKNPVANLLNLNVLTAKYSTNYKFSTIRINGITNYEENIKKLEFYENFDFLNTTIFQDEETQDLIITFEKDIQIEDINIYIEYQIEEDTLVNITPENLTSEPSDTMEVTLNKEGATLVMNFTDSSTHKDLIDYNKLDPTTTNIPRYYYVIIDYKHYNIEKVYYIDSELETIDGYLYDPEESYTKYKKYTREIISSSEPENPEDKPEDNPGNNSENKPEDNKPVENPETPKDDEEEKNDTENNPEQDKNDNEDKPTEPKPNDNKEDKPIENPENPKEDEGNKDETDNKPEEDKDHTEVKPTNPNPSEDKEENKPNENEPNNPNENTDNQDEDSKNDESQNNPPISTDKTDDDLKDENSNKEENTSKNPQVTPSSREDYEDIKSVLESIIKKLEDLEKRIQTNNRTSTVVKKPTTNTKTVTKKTSTTTTSKEPEIVNVEKNTSDTPNENNEKTTSIVTNQTSEKEKANNITKPLECEENKRSKVLTAIGVVLIFISIILDVAHFISVKFSW